MIKFITNLPQSITSKGEMIDNYQSHQYSINLEAWLCVQLNVCLCVYKMVSKIAWFKQRNLKDKMVNFKKAPGTRGSELLFRSSKNKQAKRQGDVFFLFVSVFMAHIHSVLVLRRTVVLHLHKELKLYWCGEITGSWTDFLCSCETWGILGSCVQCNLFSSSGSHFTGS